MSTEEETKKQESATQNKEASKATKATKPQQQENNKDIKNEELIIEQVRSELETYFAPQNIQNDFNLRQKMTTDGYIDIDLLLDLKLISDLVSNREILIESISRSKLLVMNTGCTMVKYMPLLERNVLILRDIPTSTKKEEIMTEIFSKNKTDSNGVSIPSEIHSDIGNNWFCQFKTEEECLNTAKYLQQHGKFNNEPLHVRVKAIHDKNKADTTPQSLAQINNSPKQDPLQPQQPISPYNQGYYGRSPQYAYYGPQPPIDPYYTYGPGGGGGGPGPGLQQPQSPPRDNRKRGPKDTAQTPPPEQDDVVVPSGDIEQGGGIKEDDRTAISDYPGVFDKYSVQEFFDVYKELTSEELEIPQSMRGRDFRIISESLLIPDALTVKEDDKTKEDEEEDDDDYKDDTQKGKKRRRRRDYNKKEVSGTYYEEEGDVYNDDEEEEEYNADEYNAEEEYNDDSYYYYNNSEYDNRYYNNYNNSNRSYNRSYNNNQQQNRNKYYSNYKQQSGGYKSRSNYKPRGRGRGGYSGGRYQSRGSYNYKPRGRGRGRSSYKPKSGGSGRQYESQQQYKSQRQYNTSSGTYWSPRQAKQYNTNKGVYRTKH